MALFTLVTFISTAHLKTELLHNINIETIIHKLTLIHSQSSTLLQSNNNKEHP